MGLWDGIVRRGTTGEVRQEDSNALRLQKHLEEMYSSYLDEHMPMMKIHYLADTDKGVCLFAVIVDKNSLRKKMEEIVASEGFIKFFHLKVERSENNIFEDIYTSVNGALE